MTRLSELVAQAAKDPYELDLEDGGAVIEIPQPTWAGWVAALALDTDTEIFAALGLSPQDAQRVSDAVNGAPMSVPGRLIDDMRNHFRLGKQKPSPPS
jgi:hypothetical protein